MTDTAASAHGCACGKQVLPSKADTWIDGVLHRAYRPCYSTDANGERVYYDVKTHLSVMERIANLERVVAELVAKGTP